MVLIHNSLCLPSQTIPRSTHCAQHTHILGEPIPAIRIPETTLCETLAPHPPPASGDLDLLGPCELTTPGTSHMTADGIWFLRLTRGIRQASSRFICLFSALVVVS